MKKFLIGILFFVFCVFATMLFVVNITNSKIEHSDVFRVSNTIEYLILGHSHSEGAFNDSIIEHSKNLSQSGELFFFTYLKVKKIIADNKQVKAVFIEFTNNQITMDMENWESDETNLLYRIPKYAPLMTFEDYRFIASKNSIALVKALPIVFKNNVNWIKNNETDYILSSDWGKYYYNKRAHVDSLLNAKKHSKIEEHDFSKVTYSNINYLFKIINYCEKNNVKVYLVRSPIHKEYSVLVNEKYFQEILNSKLKASPFMDFKDFPLVNEEYGDLDHLNYKGAKKFSIFFNNLIKKGLLEKTDKQQFINQELQKISN